ncbi:2,3,4,5-tetrahydropyridine-2,6-dicarboxylate N-succinyltransferase [Alphaproteobacteria bacterium]|nr:2,3,4,5-tetrahydropyridine-2,6-dicarboxylate N-succinyltransferase [Alphaproteobacteria bacterium]
MSQELSRITNIIEQAFENIAQINFQTSGEVRKSVEQALELLDSGKLRVCNKVNDVWQVNQWLKKAILLSFRLNDNFFSKQQAVTGNSLSFYDKVDLKFSNWQEQDFRDAGFRALPGAVVRKGSFIGKNVVLMPSFVNKGAYVDESTMVDTWATIGSCAQIGKNCHISGGVGIGGVLEPLQANPVIIEDNCFIGARSEIAEGVIIEKGSVISMGVYIGGSTKIVDRSTGKVYYGKVPAYSVVVPGSIANTKIDDKTLNLYCAVIVKKVDEKTRSKTSINELLRD